MVTNGPDAVTIYVDTVIMSVSGGGVTGILVNAEESITAQQIDAYSFLLQYPDDLNTGDPWTVTSVVTGLTFQGGLSLAPSSGTVM